MKFILKKILLIFLGIFLSLIILECGLRFAGFVLYSYQQYKNNKALENKSQYTIMCLGESTTSKQYPIQLQEILNEKYPNKFSVIDCGVPKINLENLFLFIENNINKYNPDIAICMMGINNTYDFIDHSITDFDNTSLSLRSKLKIFNLFSLLKAHIKSLLHLNEINSQEDINKDERLKEIERLFNEGKYDEVINLSEKTLKEYNNELIFFYYCNSVFRYANFIVKDDIEKEILKNKYLSLAKQAIDEKLYVARAFYYEVILFELIYQENNIEEAKKLIHNLIYDIKDIEILNDNLYNLIKPLLTEEQKKYIFQQIQKTSEISFYKFKIIESLEQKNLTEFNEYCNKLEILRLFYPDTQTYKLYKLIVKKLVDNNIKVICMQYPIRSIKPLQEQLKDEPYYDKLTFISNEKTFKNALINNSFSALFVDQFAGDFGHCTDLGNTIIAENVVKTLENILDLK